MKRSRQPHVDYCAVEHRVVMSSVELLASPYYKRVQLSRIPVIRKLGTSSRIASLLHFPFSKSPNDYIHTAKLRFVITHKALHLIFLALTIFRQLFLPCRPVQWHLYYWLARLMAGPSLSTQCGALLLR